MIRPWRMWAGAAVVDSRPVQQQPRRRPPDRPLGELPPQARALLGPHADDRERTLNHLLTECWRLGARFRTDTRPGTFRLTLR
ncbi:hypothetical protein [Streptomyces noursei]|uniref:hypothetical protein n=1 Tax=Streptomyces noursei TaxID=1971 RepID=UPI003816A27A